MADNPINQIRRAFNIPDSVVIRTSRLFTGNRKRPDATAEKFEIDNTVTTDPGLYASPLGTMVMADVEFLPGSYETNTPGIVRSFAGLKLATVLFTVNQAKKIIKTEIQGRDGTVKEYIGMDDYEVSINGVITGGNGTRPVENIAALKAIVDAPIAIDVVSAFLQSFGINQIVINNCNWDQQEGSYSYQTFSINANSDVPQELRLTNV